MRTSGISFANVWTGLADKGITYTKPRGGLLLWCDLEERINERRLYHEAESRGLLIMPGFLFYPKAMRAAVMFGCAFPISAMPTLNEVSKF